MNPKPASLSRVRPKTVNVSRASRNRESPNLAVPGADVEIAGVTIGPRRVAKTGGRRAGAANRAVLDAIGPKELAIRPRSHAKSPRIAEVMKRTVAKFKKSVAILARRDAICEIEIPTLAPLKSLKSWIHQSP